MKKVSLILVSILLGVILILSGCSKSTTQTPQTYIIQASAGAWGTISPSGNIKVQSGSDQSFTITPNFGY